MATLGSRVLAVSLLCAAPLLAQGQTWVVDAGGRPGSNFKDIPAAVAAAADGDTILIRPWSTYSGFRTGKALTMLGDPDALVGGVIEITGLAAGKTFVAANLQSGLLTTGIDIHDNDGRVHLDDVSGFLVAARAPACAIARCRWVSVTGGSFQGYPALDIRDSTVSLSSVDVNGGGAASGFGSLLASEPGLYLLRSTTYLSACNVSGGNGALTIFPNPSPAIETSGGALIVTGNSATTIVAGVWASSPPTAAIQTNGGTVDVDTTLTITGSQGGPDIGGTATVVRRRIASLTGAAQAPGGMLSAGLTSPAGDLIFVAASVAMDPVALPPLGALFIDPLLLLPLQIGVQTASGTTALSYRIPNVPALRGGVLALQAANHYLATGTTELTNPVAVVLN